VASVLISEHEICMDCGLSHTPARRQKTLRRLLPATREELMTWHPCWWGVTRTGSQRLLVDLRAVGAELETAAAVPGLPQEWVVGG